MSAPLAGKFQDHYEVLGITAGSNIDLVQMAYQSLVNQCHPSQGSEPDQEQFDAVNLAYEILSDPELKAEFDKLKGVKEPSPTFNGMRFFATLGQDAQLRTAVMCVMFDRRRTYPMKPTLTVRLLEAMLEVTNDELTLALWYLRNTGLLLVDDKSNMQITVAGIDYLEAHPPSARLVMPLIKASALVPGTEMSQKQLDALAAAEVLATRNRAADIAVAESTAENSAEDNTAEDNTEDSAEDNNDAADLLALGEAVVQSPDVQSPDVQAPEVQASSAQAPDVAQVTDSEAVSLDDAQPAQPELSATEVTATATPDTKPAAAPQAPAENVSPVRMLALQANRNGKPESVSAEQAKSVAGRLFRVLRPADAPAPVVSNLESNGVHPTPVEASMPLEASPVPQPQLSEDWDDEDVAAGGPSLTPQGSIGR